MEGRCCRGNSILLQTIPQSLARSGWTPGATIEPIDIEWDCWGLPAIKDPESIDMQRGTDSPREAAWVCGVHWPWSVCESSSLSLG